MTIWETQIWLEAELCSEEGKESRECFLEWLLNSTLESDAIVSITFHISPFQSHLTWEALLISHHWW